MSDLTPSQLRGGVFDFSQLKKPAGEPAGAQTDSTSTYGAASRDAASANLAEPQVDFSQPFSVPSLVIEADIKTLPDLLQLSNLVPMLVDLYTARTPTSAGLTQKLRAEVERRAGQVLMIRLDGDANPQLLKAFQVEHLPAVTALLKGQSIPLFAGEQTAETVASVIDRMLAVAKDNGILGTVEVDPNAQPLEPQEPELPPKHMMAFELIDKGDYDGAIAQYQSILAESPADQLAVSGLAQVQLLKRVDGVDFAKIASSAVASVEDAIVKADVFAVHGNFGDAFKVILDCFETAEKAQRDVLREHLLDLFKVAPIDDPAVAAARIRLANLLF